MEKVFSDNAAFCFWFRMRHMILQLLVRYLNDSIKIDDDENYYQTPLTPVGVNRTQSF